jgi:hypothetical protein
MFSELDNIIFPDSCEVIEIVPSQHYVYPIFKNGSSSLRETQKKTHWISLYNQDIAQIQQPITVYLRDPKQRFISGVNTFVQHYQQDWPQMDAQTVLHFAANYLWLNRHFCPQFFWLVNLARYSHVPIVFQDLQSINQFVAMNDRAEIVPPDTEFLEKLQTFPWHKLELYFFLDQILIDQIGKTVTFKQIMSDIKTNHSELYNLVFHKTISITNVLSTT